MTREQENLCVKRILIVDDNDRIHRDFSKILNANPQSNKLDKADAALFGPPQNNGKIKQSYLLDSVHQGQKAVELVAKAILDKKPYALAFVDMVMPLGWNGMETVRRIWLEDPSIQIVICSAYAQKSWEEIIHKLGSPDSLLLLKKPFEASEITQLAAVLTRKWELNHSSDIQSDKQVRTKNSQELMDLPPLKDQKREPGSGEHSSEIKEFEKADDIGKEFDTKLKPDHQTQTSDVKASHDTDLTEAKNLLFTNMLKTLANYPEILLEVMNKQSKQDPVSASSHAISTQNPQKNQNSLKHKMPQGLTSLQRELNILPEAIKGGNNHLDSILSQNKSPETDRVLTQMNTNAPLAATRPQSDPTSFPEEKSREDNGQLKNTMPFQNIVHPSKNEPNSSPNQSQDQGPSTIPTQNKSNLSNQKTPIPAKSGLFDHIRESINWVRQKFVSTKKIYEGKFQTQFTAARQAGKLNEESLLKIIQTLSHELKLDFNTARERSANVLQKLSLPIAAGTVRNPVLFFDAVFRKKFARLDLEEKITPLSLTQLIRSLAKEMNVRFDSARVRVISTLIDIERHDLLVGLITQKGM